MIILERREFKKKKPSTHCHTEVLFPVFKIDMENINFKMKKYQWKPTNCREFDAYKCRLAAILFVPGQIYNFRPRMKKIFMDYENS